MFVFLTALKHPQTAKSYDTVTQLLDTTLSSVLKQTNTNFKVVVVCNQIPDIQHLDERVVFHQVSFPAVEKVNGKLDTRQKFLDKGSKYFSGLLFARQFSPEYVYILDSDDWVNVKLVDYVMSAAPKDIFYVNHGYFANMQNKEFKKKSGMLNYCGSTFVYNFDFLLKHANITKDVDHHADQQALIDATSSFFVERLLSNHTINYFHFKKLGARISSIKLRTVCWVQSTGENVSSTQGGDNGLPIDAEFIETFGLSQDFLNSKQVSMKDKVRNYLIGAYSAIAWRYTQLTGKKVF